MGAKGEIQLHVCGMPQCSIMQLILTATVEWKMVGGEEVRLSLCFPQQTYGLLHLIQFSKPENSVDPTALKGWSYDPNHSQLTPMRSTAHRVFISFWLFDCRLFVASLLCVCVCVCLALVRNGILLANWISVATHLPCTVLLQNNNGTRFWHKKGNESLLGQRVFGALLLLLSIKLETTN